MSPTPAVPRRLLLVSGSMGGGHHAAARAVEEQARRAWPGVETAWTETLADMGPGTGTVFRAVYAGCVRRAPWLYGLYFWLLWRLPPFRAGTRAVLGAWSARGLRPAIARHAPDVVVATFPEAVQGLGRLRRRGLLPMTAVVLVADPAPHPLWVDPALDLHLVSTPEGAALARRIAPRARVRVAALPVAAAFRPPQRLPPRVRPLVYVTCGSFAFGDVPAACAAVLAGGADVLVGCGRSARLRRRLDGLARAHPGRVDVRDWVDDPVAATRHCDAVVTNAGGATALEALACARPLLLFDPIPGHGRANAEVLAAAGAARICPTPAALTAAVAAPPAPPVFRRDWASDLAALTRCRTTVEGPRVRAQDALFLHVAAPPQQMGACVVLDDAARRRDWPEYVAARVRERGPGIDLLRRRLAPPRAGRPLRWLLVPTPDPARHVRPHVATVDPQGHGFEAALTAFLAVPLDPTSAPWALQVARDGDRVAVLAKVHHALGDGIAVTEALADLLVDERPEARGRPCGTAAGRHRVRRATLALRGVASLARAGFAGPSPLGRASGDVRWVGLTLDGGRVRTAARGHGVGTSALLVAAVAEALHRLRPGPRHATLRAMVPVTNRGRADVVSRASGNRTAAVPLDLPLGPMSLAERVGRVADAMERNVRTCRPEGASCALAALGLLPAGLQRAAARLVYGPPFFHAIASVMPGVRRPLHVRGAPIVLVHPALPLATRVGLAVGVMHWRAHTTIGFTTSIPGLADALPAAVERVVAEFAEPVSPRRPSAGART